MTIRPRFPIEQLPRIIGDLLQISPRTVEEMERLTDYSGAAIRVRLANLEDVGHIHRVRVGIKGARGCYYLWHFGPAPESAPESDAGPACNMPKQHTVTQYAPIGRRDDLVTALYGPASISSPTTPPMHSPTVDSAPAGRVDVALHRDSQEVA